MRDQVLHPYKTTGKIIVLFIKTLMLWGLTIPRCKRKLDKNVTQDFGLRWIPGKQDNVRNYNSNRFDTVNIHLLVATKWRQLRNRHPGRNM
jgi:hypothetical protein